MHPDENLVLNTKFDKISEFLPTKRLDEKNSMMHGKNISKSIGSQK